MVRKRSYTRKFTEEAPKKPSQYFVVYIGKHKHISLSPGVGRVTRGKEYEITEEMANTLRQSPRDWQVVER